MRQFNLVSQGDALRRFESAKFAWLAARAYPTAPLEELLIVADWNIWLFVHDDQCDEARIGRHPEELAQVYERFREILAGDVPTPIDLSETHALHELWQRIGRHSSPDWRNRFLRSVEEYFEACIWEAGNRAADRIPDLQTYIRLRPYTGALNTDLELIEICEHICLPAAVRQEPVLHRLMAICNNVVCWSNDIISLTKELRNDQRHNLVIILKHEQHCSWQEAVERVAAMHNAEVREFIQLVPRLPSFGEAIDGEVARFVAILRAWMRGNLDWALDSGRYGDPRTNVEQGKIESKQL